MTQLKREDVPKEQTWDLTNLFPTRESWEKTMKSLNEEVKAVTDYKGRLAESATMLYEALCAYETLYEKLVKVRTYAFLRTSVDGGNAEYQSDLAKATAILAKVGGEIAFFEPELLTIPESTINEFIEAHEPLRNYKKMLDDLIDKKDHTLSTKVEQVLAQLSEALYAPHMIYERSKQADMKFPSFLDDNGKELPLSEALYEDRYEISPNTTIRRNSYTNYVNTLEKYKNTIAAVYATEVTKQVQLAKIRNYNSVTEMLLHPHDVSVEMYENQLNVIQKELAPHMRRLATLKKETLQLDQMTYADLKAPLDPDFEPEITFSRAKEMILEALQVLGPEYIEIMEAAFNERWIDYSNNIGKQSGAFCSSPYGSNSFILLTWTDMMRGTFTLAHELGHAGHFQLANRNQTILNTNVSTYFVEAPSTLNELLLAEHMLKQSNNDRMRAFVINNLLDTYYHNFVTHMLEAEFQYRIYKLAEEGIPLTADLLTKQKYEAITNFWGDDVDVPESAGLIWMRQPHYYMGLYPYTYSAGLTISTAVNERIKEEGESVVEKWLDVLKAGSTLKPVDLAKNVGVDMTKKETIQKAVDYVGSLISELERIYK